jgi:nitrite reductase (NADH) large subunit
VNDIILNSEEWYQTHGIKAAQGQEGCASACWQRQVQAKTERSRITTSLLLATGSQPFILPLPGKDLWCCQLQQYVV